MKRISFCKYITFIFILIIIFALTACGSRKEYTAADYREMLDALLPEVTIIAKEEMSDYDYSLIRHALENEFIEYENMP